MSVNALWFRRILKSICESQSALGYHPRPPPPSLGKYEIRSQSTANTAATALTDHRDHVDRRSCPIEDHCGSRTINHARGHQHTQDGVREPDVPGRVGTTPSAADIRVHRSLGSLQKRGHKPDGSRAPHSGECRRDARDSLRTPYSSRRDDRLEDGIVGGGGNDVVHVGGARSDVQPSGQGSLPGKYAQGILEPQEGVAVSHEAATRSATGKPLVRVGKGANQEEPGEHPSHQVEEAASAAVAALGDTAPSTENNTGLRIRRQIISKAADKRYQQASSKVITREAEPDNPLFENVIIEASRRQRDGLILKVKGRELNNKFRHERTRDEQHLQRQAARRRQIQEERHQYAASRDWRLTLRILDTSTTDGLSAHKKRTETVKLPTGVVGQWNGNAGEQILEIMLRTGGHVQVLPAADVNLNEDDFTGFGHVDDIGGFTEFTLLGTPAQNEEAKDLLPDYLHVFAAGDTEQSKGLKDYNLLSEYTDKYGTTLCSISAGEAFDPDQADPAFHSDPPQHLTELVDDIIYAVPETPPPIRAVWYRENACYGPSDTRLSGRPEQMSLISLERYVHEVVSRPAPRLARRAQYGPQNPRDTQAHVEITANELVSLFSDAKILPFVSSEPLDLAFRFLGVHSKMPELRRIFQALDVAGFEFTAANFETLLTTAAKAGDVHNFSYHVQLMIKRQITPGWKTWSLLHALVSRVEPDGAAEVERVMRKKGVLENLEARFEVAENYVFRDFARHLDTGGSLETFLYDYDQRWESGRWLTASACNKMVQALCLRGKLDVAMDLVSELEARNRTPTVVTLNTLLAGADKMGNMEAVVVVMKHFAGEVPQSRFEHGDSRQNGGLQSLESDESTNGGANAPGRTVESEGTISQHDKEMQRQITPAEIQQPMSTVIPDEMTLEILLRLACKRHYWNVARVVWRHACLTGNVSWRAMRRVEKSLRCYNPMTGAAPSRGQLWRSWAGMFVVGVEADSRRSGPEIIGADTGGLPTPAPQADSEPTTYSRQDLYSLLQRDLGEAGSLKPVVPFHDQLHAAWERDLRWKERGLGVPGGLPLTRWTNRVWTEMVAHGVKVPVCVGNAMTLPSRKR